LGLPEIKLGGRPVSTCGSEPRRKRSALEKEILNQRR